MQDFYMLLPPVSFFIPSMSNNSSSFYELLLNEALTTMRQYCGSMEVIWNKLLDSTTDNMFLWHVFGLNIGMALIYWSFGIIYLIMDITKKPKFLQKYKMDRDKEVNIDWIIMKKLLIQVSFNQIVVGIIFTTITYPLLLLRGTPDLRAIPSISVFLLEFYSCWLIREVLFYYLHRLSHHRLLYKFVHKKHHRWTAPIALSAEFCTPYEHVLTNLIPTLIGPLVVGTHYFSIFIWFVHVMLSTLQKHSGYDIPFYYNSTRHNTHHENFTTNYGLIGIMDWLHGTSSDSTKRKKVQ